MTCCQSRAFIENESSGTNMTSCTQDKLSKLAFHKLSRERVIIQPIEGAGKHDKLLYNPLYD
jgi:hypothetical protein